MRNTFFGEVVSLNFLANLISVLTNLLVAHNINSDKSASVLHTNHHIKFAIQLIGSLFFFFFFF